jgi:choline dehydrogenase-like flavoprotein
MFDDCRTSHGAADLDTDLCVIGAGAAGIAAAREFLHTTVRVLLIESGGLRQLSAAELLNEGENVGRSRIDLTAGRARGFGGTTRLWAGQCIPLEESDFEPRPWVPHSGWPIRIRDLAPLYLRAASMLGVAPAIHIDRLYHELRLRPPAFGEDLGHVATVFAPVIDFGDAFETEFRRAPNIRVLLHGTVTSLTANESRSSVTYAHIQSSHGTRLRVRARVFVLCAGGIENARILLLSDGLGNGRDLVGRFLQDHPNGRAAEIETPARERLQDVYGLLYRRPLRYYPKLRLSPALQRRRGVLSCAVMINSDFTAGVEAAKQLYRASKSRQLSSETLRNIVRVVADVPHIASTVYRRYVRGLSPTSRNSRLWLQTYAEQAPNPESRVTLSDVRDARGIPAARVHWRLNELDRLTAVAAVDTVGKEFARLALGAIRPAEWVQSASADWVDGVHDAYHQMGTTRMSDDPAIGVVDRHCQVHGVANLYVAGSSVFPTGGYSNPTLTIVALACRLADRLKQTGFARD